MAEAVVLMEFVKQLLSSNVDLNTFLLLYLCISHYRVLKALGLSINPFRSYNMDVDLPRAPNK